MEVFIMKLYQTFCHFLRRSSKYRGTDKSLARPVRKQARATKL